MGGDEYYDHNGLHRHVPSNNFRPVHNDFFQFLWIDHKLNLNNSCNGKLGNGFFRATCVDGFKKVGIRQRSQNKGCKNDIGLIQKEMHDY